MEIKLFKPESTLLQPYIECFYTLTRTPDEPPVAYLGFPTYYTFVVLYDQAKISIQAESGAISHALGAKPESFLIMDFEKPGMWSYQGATSEISVYFKPLGLNAFLPKALATYKTATISLFSPFPDYQKKCIEIFSLSGAEEKIQALEAYLVASYRGFQHPFLHKVVADLMNAEATTNSISTIAVQQGITRATLNKHFHMHLGTSPAQFRKIIRFRRAMQEFRANVTPENLVDISYLVAYFDQSHMVKDFRALTGYTPKTFFSKLSQMENGQINWLFV